MYKYYYSIKIIHILYFNFNLKYYSGYHSGDPPGDPPGDLMTKNILIFESILCINIIIL